MLEKKKKEMLPKQKLNITLTLSKMQKKYRTLLLNNLKSKE